MKPKILIALLLGAGLFLTACSGGDKPQQGATQTTPPISNGDPPRQKLEASIDTIFDINKSAVTVDSNPNRALALGSHLVFNATNSKGERLWWVSDGSESGTIPLLGSGGEQLPALGYADAIKLGDHALLPVHPDQWWITDGDASNTYQSNVQLDGGFINAHRLGDTIYIIFGDGIAIYNINDHSSRQWNHQNNWLADGEASIADSYYSSERDELLLDVRSPERSELWRVSRVSGDQPLVLASWPLNSADSSAATETMRISAFSFSEQSAAVVYSIGDVAQIDLVDLKETGRQTLFTAEPGQEIWSSSISIIGDLVFFGLYRESADPSFISTYSTDIKIPWIYVSDAAINETYLLTTSLPLFFPAFHVEIAAGTIHVITVGLDLSSAFNTSTSWYVYSSDTHQLTLRGTWSIEASVNVPDLPAATICDSDDDEIVFCLPKGVYYGFSEPSSGFYRRRFNVDGSFIQAESDLSLAEFVELKPDWPDPSTARYWLSSYLPVRMGEYWYLSTKDYSLTDSIGVELYRFSNNDSEIELVKDIAQWDGKTTSSSNPRGLHPVQQQLWFLADTDINPRTYMALSSDDELQELYEGYPEARHHLVVQHENVGEILLYSFDYQLFSRISPTSDSVELLPGYYVYELRPDLTDTRYAYLHVRSTSLAWDAPRQLWITDGTPEGTHFTGIEMRETKDQSLPTTFVDGAAYEIDCNGASITDLNTLEETRINFTAEYCLSTYIVDFVSDTFLLQSKNKPKPDNSDGVDVPAAQLWTLGKDGTRTELIGFPKLISSAALINDIIYFEQESTLWRSDLTSAGTWQVAGNLSEVSNLVSINEQVYFTACDLAEVYRNCKKLWTFNGQASRDNQQLTALDTLNSNLGLTPFTVTFYFSDIRYVPLSVYQQQLIFPYCPSVDKCQIWTSDGSAGNARLLLDIGGTARDGGAQEITVLGDSLLFSAETEEYGRELVKASLQMVDEL